jgi:hypothetical protein
VRKHVRRRLNQILEACSGGFDFSEGLGMKALSCLVLSVEMGQILAVQRFDQNVRGYSKGNLDVAFEIPGGD